MSQKILAFSLLFIATNALGYSLDDYLEDVKKENNLYRALENESKANELQMRQGDLIFTPQLFFNAQHSYDGKKALLDPLQVQKRVENDLYSLGIAQKFDFGVEAKLSYDVSKTNLLGSGFMGNVSDYRDVWDATPRIELSVSLWGNSFGKSDQAQRTLLVEQKKAQSFQSRAQKDALLVQAEIAYWNLAALQESVRIQRDTLNAAQSILKYVSDQRAKNLREYADVLQAQAMVDYYRLLLEQAQMDERAGRRKFNQYLNAETLTDVPKLDGLNYSELEKKTAPQTMSGSRADIKALLAQIELARANAVVANESVKPKLDLYAAYALNGRDDEASDAMDDAWTSKRESGLFGVRFQMPLNFSAVSDVKQGANMNVLAAELKHKHAVYDQEAEWKDLVQKFNDAKRSLKLAREIEKVQKAKLDNERVRLRQGRTTTYQILLFEQDYNEAQTMRIKTASQILAIESQFKMYNASVEGN